MKSISSPGFSLKDFAPVLINNQIAFTMNPQTKELSVITRIRFFWMIPLLLFYLSAYSQPDKRLKPDVYDKFINPNTRVRVQTIEKNKVAKTDTAILRNLQFSDVKKQIVPYDDKILAIDKASFEKIKTTSLKAEVAENVKVIPEIHVEPVTGQSEPVAYRILFAFPQPLRYDDTLNKFTGLLRFFLENESSDNDSRFDSVGIAVTSDQAATITPEAFKIGHFSIPFSIVSLVADRNVKDSALVRVSTVSNPKGYPTYIPVKTALKISSNRTILQGLGIQATPVIVEFVGSNSSDSVEVNFSASKGTVTPASLYVHINKPATVYLRSEGTGNCKLSAISTIAGSNDLNFSFTFPWIFLLATILGGLTGSFIKYYATPEKKKVPLKLILAGIGTGLVGAAAYYAVGINLLGISFNAAFNEIAVFVISALFAYGGILAIDKLKGKK